MTSYAFYVAAFGGGAIAEDDWPAYAARAQDQLEHYRRIYTVRGGERAAQMAVCAMAEAMYAFDQAENGALGAASVSIGSVSSSRAQGALPDASPKAKAEELYRCARRYLAIERWCGPCSG